jgi:HlyD family secretion protein
LVKNGTQVALVELEDKRLQAVLYFFLLEGKKILPGMPAQVTPTTIKEEEYGFMYGKVIYASEFPATPQELTRQFHNEDLVRKILSRGSPIEVHVELIADDKTPTGYKWSSKTGPPGQIYSGTLCRAKVIVRRQRPVSLLIPAVKRNILGIGEQH